MRFTFNRRKFLAGHPPEKLRGGHRMPGDRAGRGSKSACSLQDGPLAQGGIQMERHRTFLRREQQASADARSSSLGRHRRANRGAQDQARKVSTRTRSNVI